LRIAFKDTGLGDAWMRMMALMTLARLSPRERHVVYPPKVLVPLARRVFEGSFDVEYDGRADIEMRHHGLRHLLPGMLAGKKYYSPFYWILRETRTQNTVKDKINDFAFQLAVMTTRLSRPSRRYVFEYQGFMEMQGLRPFRDVGLEEYSREAQKDLDALNARVSAMFPMGSPNRRIVVFPSGSSHQIMPPTVAARLLPSADYAFHEKDEYSQEFIAAGLSVVRFSTPPEEICELIAPASAVVCTDSFPSHLAQMWKNKTTVALTHMKTGTTIHPGFPSLQVLHSRAECNPCRNNARTGPDHRCQAGRMFCATWENLEYLAQLSKVGSTDLITLQ
jgi:hypothetical protein